MIYIYIYVNVNVCMYIYICIYICMYIDVHVTCRYCIILLQYSDPHRPFFCGTYATKYPEVQKHSRSIAGMGWEMHLNNSMSMHLYQ